MRIFFAVFVLAFFCFGGIVFAVELGSSSFSGDLSKTGFPVTARVTCYAPGADPTIEGPFATSYANITDGRKTPMTLDCVRLKKCQYVTLAAHPQNQGKFFYIGTFEYRSPIDGNWYTLENLVGFVHDRGSAFDSRECAKYNTCSIMHRKFDVAVGDFTGGRWKGGAGSRFVDKQPYCANKDAQWRQLTGQPLGAFASISGMRAGGPLDTFNNLTGGALNNNSVGRLLGIPQQQQAINGVQGGAPQAIPPTLAAPTINTPAPDKEQAQTGLSITSGTTSGTTNTEQKSTPATAPPPNTDVLEGKLPTLLCVPGIVEANEPALLVYGCNDESTSGEGTGFATNGATSGVVRVTATETTTYTFACNKGTKAQCAVEVIAPKLSLLATPTKVMRGRGVELSWLTEDVQQCIVKSSSHANFVREGVSLTQGEVVEVQTPSIFQNTTFTLTCETSTGSIHKKEVVVEVL